jgi:hypothetical protein
LRWENLNRSARGLNLSYKERHVVDALTVSRCTINTKPASEKETQRPQSEPEVVAAASDGDGVVPDGRAVVGDDFVAECEAVEVALEIVVVDVAKRYACDATALAASAPVAVGILQVVCGQPAYVMPSD